MPNEVTVYAKKSGGSDDTVVIERCPIIKPSQMAKVRSNGRILNIGGRSYLDTVIEYTDGGGTVKKKNIKGYVRQSDLEGIDPSQVSVPANFAGLEAVMVPTRLEYQFFRIYEVIEDEDCVTITARHVWYDNLQNYTLWKPTENTSYSVAATCRNIIDNAISPVSSRVASDCTDTVKHKENAYEKKNIVECFLDPENGVCAKYGLSLIRNNWDFYCLKDVGYNRGMVIQNGKNLLGVERKESIENLATRIAPIGKDEKGEIIWLNYQNKKYIDSQYIGDYAYPRVEIFETGLQVGKEDVTAQNIQDKLLQAAQKRFSEDKVDLPSVEMTIEFISLGDTEEYRQYRDLDKVYLYDILTIKDTIRDYSYTAQVIGVVHDILTGQLLSVTIGKLDNWDGTRKIATWQVPEVNGENIRLKSILAGSFDAQAIQGEDLANGALTYYHFAAATIDHLVSDSITAVTAQIHEIIAGSITAEDIQAGSITTIVLAANAITADKIAADAVTASKIAADAVTADKILAGAITSAKIAADAVTAEKISSGAITADKIAAGAINADKIDATAISAINAKLGTATIANGYIQNANIDYARVKDISADEAIITTSITEQGIADRLYINRLQITYGQMVAATIGDLVIGDSNGDYFHIDVEWDEYGVPSLVPTHVDTPSAAEISAGHTLDGKTIIGDVGTFAELSSEDFYAINGIIDRITAKRIDVDELWARQAFINQLMVTDISSNTYIQSTIGNWQSGSTITQTIDGINSRISSLGYGTIFYSTTEPDPTGVVVGDVWIEPISDNTWNDIAVYTYDDISNFTWEQIAGPYRMYVWTGTQWKLLFDNMIVNELQTEIAQNAYAITLKADKSEVNVLSGQVTEFAATLEVQSEQISAAVSSVNAKSANYKRITDPSDDPLISLNVGDTWTKDVSDWTWNGSSAYAWEDLTDICWDELSGASMFVWSGAYWIQTSDYGVTVNNRTLIEQNAEQIRLEALARVQLGNDLLQTRAELSITNSSIRAEVERATTAEGGKIDKTSQYQTADAIVTEAVRQAGINADGNYIEKTTTYQDASSIVTEAVRQAGVNAANGFLAKTTSYQTADSIVTEAVRQAGVNAGSAYIAKTSSYQTADAIVNEAVRQSTASIGNRFIERTSYYQTADSIVLAAEQYATTAAGSAETAAKNYAKNYTDNNAYAIISGITITSAGVQVTGSKYIKLDVNANNYVHISSAGIDMKGSRVNVNGNDMWARDDIIIMNPNASGTEAWRKTVSSIESAMSGHHDWVLVRPYYNATLLYTYGRDYTMTAHTLDPNIIQMIQEGGANSSFGVATTYTYQLKFTIPKQSFIELGVTAVISNSPTFASGNLSKTETVAPSTTVDKEFTFSWTSSTNLCAENTKIYLKMQGTGRTIGGVYGINLTCTCDATTSRVPCTVYYYP